MLCLGYAPVWGYLLERVVAMHAWQHPGEDGAQALERALRDLRRPRRQRVTLDLDLRSGEVADDALPATLSGTLRDLDPSLVCLGVPVEDVVALGGLGNSVLAALRATGVRLAVTGVGRTHRAQDLLAGLPVQALRVAPDLVPAAAMDRAAAGMARALASLGWSLDLVTVATGVASTAQLRHALDMGFDRAEGPAVRATAPSWPLP
jgi:EAL domain-containing protein (putative c-di-GMP-specific phosphodiesterase class I)